MGAVGDAAAKLGATVLAPELERACKDWGIDTPEMQARFLAQCFVETRQFRRLVESFNYSVEGLRATFSAARIGDKDCAILGRHPGHAAEEQLIANKVYGGLWGRNRLGNTEPGDGWLFKGRGCAMITGRDNYARCGEALNLDLIHHPEMLVQLRYAAQSAGWFWRTKKCADCADNKAVSIAWNGGTNALAERMAAYQRAKMLLGEA
jgi:putative chitinase